MPRKGSSGPLCHCALQHTGKGEGRKGGRAGGRVGGGRGGGTCSIYLTADSLLRPRAALSNACGALHQCTNSYPPRASRTRFPRTPFPYTCALVSMATISRSSAPPDSERRGGEGRAPNAAVDAAVAETVACACCAKQRCLRLWAITHHENGKRGTEGQREGGR